MIKTVKPTPTSYGLVEDKEEARAMRLGTILPALDAAEAVIIDFTEIRDATQSYVHALIGEALKKHGADALKYIEFRGCNERVQHLVRLVVSMNLDT